MKDDRKDKARGSGAKSFAGEDALVDTLTGEASKGGWLEIGEAEAQRDWTEAGEQGQQRTLELDRGSAAVDSGEEMRARERLLESCEEKGLKQNEKKGKDMGRGRRPE